MAQCYTFVYVCLIYMFILLSLLDIYKGYVIVSIYEVRYKILDSEFWIVFTIQNSQ